VLNGHEFQGLEKHTENMLMMNNPHQNFCGTLMEGVCAIVPPCDADFCQNWEQGQSCDLLAVVDNAETAPLPKTAVEVEESASDLSGGEDFECLDPDKFLDKDEPSPKPKKQAPKKQPPKKPTILSCCLMGHCKVRACAFGITVVSTVLFTAFSLPCCRDHLRRQPVPQTNAASFQAQNSNKSRMHRRENILPWACSRNASPPL